jgi:hypothetical protein
VSVAPRLSTLVVLGLAAFAPPALAQDPAVRLGACDGSSSVQPTSVTLTCADAGVIAHDLTWQMWGAPAAAASATATVNTCEPDCASGSTEDFAVELTADRIKACRDGSRRYTRVRYHWPQGSPYPTDAPGSINPYIEFPCPLPRPKLNGMRMRLTGHGSAGAGYYVRVTVRLRICAPRQRMTATFQERKTLGSTTFGRYARSVGFGHAGGCRWRTMKWKLRDDFFGIGTYSVTGRLLDSQGHTSRRLTRRSVTTD